MFNLHGSCYDGKNKHEGGEYPPDFQPEFIHLIDEHSLKEVTGIPPLVIRLIFYLNLLRHEF